jgi:exodeoxyribonuclease-3
VKIASWNINGLRARFDFLKIWLADRKPDVVGLQELKMEEDVFPFDEFSDLGYHAIAYGQKAWNGVAILSKGPIDMVEFGLSNQDAFGSRRIVVDTLGIRVANLYCPNGKNLEHADYARKLEWFDSLIEASKSLTTRQVIMGDFNIVHSGLDSHLADDDNAVISHTSEERARLTQLLELGLSDSFRSLHPTERSFSWWDYRGGAFRFDRGLRIDLILGTDEVMNDTTSAWIDRDYRKKKEGLTASDHAPVILEIR